MFILHKKLPRWHRPTLASLALSLSILLGAVVTQPVFSTNIVEANSFERDSLTEFARPLPYKNNVILARHTDGSRHSILERFFNWSNFVNRWRSFNSNGVQLTDIEIFKEGNTNYFAGVWEANLGTRSSLYRYNSWSAFTNKWDELADANQRLVDIEVSRQGNGTSYTGVWRPGNDGYGLYRFSSWPAFVDKWRELAKKNLRLVDIEVTKEGDRTYYTGVWRSGTYGYALYRETSWSNFVDRWETLADDNLRLVDIEIVRSGNRTYYVGIWRSGNDGYALYNFDSWPALLNKWQELDLGAWKLVDVEVESVGNQVRYIGVWRSL